MIQDALDSAGLGFASTVGLVIFVAVFVGVCVWALTRSRRQVKRWSELPLSEDPSDSHNEKKPNT